MGADDVLDMLLLVVVLAILSPIMVANAIPLFRGDVGGFDTLIDKTAQQTAGEIVPAARSFKSEDVLLMAIIADRKSPKPAVIQSIVDGVSEEIKVTDLLNDRNAKLNELNNHTTYTGELMLQTYIGVSGMRKWVISRK